SDAGTSRPLRWAQPLDEAQAARNVVIEPQCPDDVLVLQLSRVERRSRLDAGLAPVPRDPPVHRVPRREEPRLLVGGYPTRSAEPHLQCADSAAQRDAKTRLQLGAV